MRTRALLAGAGLAMLLVATCAEAAHCPVGQFYRPSRHICVGRAEFIRVTSHRFASAGVKLERPEAVPTPPPAPKPRVTETPPAQTSAKSPFGNIPGVDLN
jgi:hypothetical protein